MWCCELCRSDGEICPRSPGACACVCVSVTASGVCGALPDRRTTPAITLLFVLAALQVSSSNAQKRRINSDKKMQNNITKRGMVPDPAAEVRAHACPSACASLPPPRPLTLCWLFVQRRAGKLSVGPILLGFFFVVIVGSCAHDAREPHSTGRRSWRAVPAADASSFVAACVQRCCRSSDRRPRAQTAEHDGC